MEISVAARRQQFDAPGDHAGGFGAILGMGSNAIVHKLELAIVDPAAAAAQSSDDLPPSPPPRRCGRSPHLGR